MKRILIYALSLCTVLLTGCNNGDDGLLDVPDGWAHKAVSLAVTPKTADVPVGLTQQLEADAVLETGATVRVTTDSHLTWSSSDTTIATIDAAGLVTGLTKGTVTITAEGVNNDGSTVRDTATITVSDAIATTLTVTPKTKTLAKGLTQAYKAEVLMSNGQVIDVTTNAALNWSSSEVSVATISNAAADKGLAQSLAKGTTTIKAEGIVNGKTLFDTATLTVGEATAARLEVTPVNASVAVGLEQAFTAEVILTDGSAQNVTESATWTSDDIGTALVSDAAGTKGIALGKAVSPASSPAGIHASITIDGTEYSDTAFLTVTDAVVMSFNVSPASATVPKGLTQPFTAEATLSDGRVINVTDNAAVSWTSSDNAIASISNNAADKGLATGVVIGGPVTIKATATVAGRTYNSTAELTVTNAIVSSIQVTPATGTTPKGLTQAFVATATFSDGRTQDVTTDPAVSWSSSDTSIATISNSTGSEGLATGEEVGDVTITATDTSGPTPVSGTATLTVTDAIVVGLQVTPPTETTPIGLTKSFTATAVLSDGRTQDVTTDPAVSWTSSDASIASVSNGADKGTATGVSTGSVTITATGTVSTGPMSGTATLTVTDAVVSSLVVTPTTDTTPIGLTKSFTATAYLSDGISAIDVTTDPAVSWSSSDTAIATVDNGANKGEAKGMSVGSATITASGITPEGKPVSGTATLNVTNAEVASLSVTPTTQSTPIGLTKSFTASATLSDGRVIDVTNDPAISWSSSDGAIATISSGQASGNGVATGVSVGSVTITAQGVANSTPFSATATLNVTDAVVSSLQVTPATASTPVGLTKAFMATAILSDGVTTIDVTTDPAISWTSSNTAVATVDASGIATGVSMGTTTITASGTTPEGAPLSATATLTVTDAIIRSLVVTPATESTPIGLSKPFTATAILSDGVTTIDVTADPAISWTSSDTSIATISTSGANKGEATGEALGTVTITAAGTTPEGTPLTGTAQLTVTDAVATDLQVTPPTETTPVGLTKGFTANLMMSDGTAPDVTEQVEWLSSDTAIATIVSGAPSGNGVATGEALGEVTITATHSSGKSSTATLTVTSKVVTALDVTPATAATPAGLTKPFTATVTYSDASTDDVTNSVSWTSSDTGIATIESDGIATGVNPGSVTITASDTTSGETATASLDVTAAVVSSIEVTPPSASVPAGLTQQFTATATMSDGTTPDITDDPATSWTSSDTGTATIASSLTSGNGLATGVAPGTTSITASYATGGAPVTDTATLTVSNAVLESITVTPDPITVGVGSSKSGNLTAMGVFSDSATPVDITADVDWTGHDVSVATVESGATNGGLVTGVVLGTTTTTATLDDGYGTPVSSTPATITVAKSLTGITVTPAEVTIIGTETKQLTAVGAYDDGSTSPITEQVAWVIADETAVQISEGTGGGLVSQGSASNMTTTAYATLSGVDSNIVDITTCTDLKGPCIDVFDPGDADGKLFTSSPSAAYAEVLGLIGWEMCDGWLCYFHSHAEEVCDRYTEVELANRTNWRLATADELSIELITASGGNLEESRGWPAIGLWTSTQYDLTRWFYLYPHDPAPKIAVQSTKRGLSCVSEP